MGEGAVEVFGSFRMNGDNVGACFDIRLDEGVYGFDHQVNVEDFFGVGADGFYNDGADGEVGDEVAVHDIDMDVVGTGFVDGADFFAQAGEIGGEDGGGDFDDHGVFYSLLWRLVSTKYLAAPIVDGFHAIAMGVFFYVAGLCSCDAVGCGGFTQYAAAVLSVVFGTFAVYEFIDGGLGVFH